MKRDLRNALLSLDDVGFRELELCIGVAKKCGDIIVKYDKTPEWFANEMGISIAAVRGFITGAHNYTMEEIAKIDVMYEQLCISTKREAVNA